MLVVLVVACRVPQEDVVPQEVGGASLGISAGGRAPLRPLRPGGVAVAALDTAVDSGPVVLAATGDTAVAADTGVTLPIDTGGPPQPAPLEARVSVDADQGEFPLRVVFDATGSSLGTGLVTYEWSFGDGAVTRDGELTVHTYVGEGDFDATLTLIDDGNGATSEAHVTIAVDTPECPVGDLPLAIGLVEDEELEEVSGIAASRVDPTVYWVHEDSDEEHRVVAVDTFGLTLSTHDLPDEFVDFEDIDVVVDPETAVPMMFLGDFGDNDHVRAEVAVWVAEEPDPYVDDDLDPLRMALTYPDGPQDAETLLVDPYTLDLFVLTKDSDLGASVYLKRAPHDDEGPFVLEALGTWPDLDLQATGGDVSANGFRVVVRDYSDTALMWMRDGYLPLEAAFDHEPCEIAIADEEQGEAIAFTVDGTGLVTTSEGENAFLWFVDL